MLLQTQTPCAFLSNIIVYNVSRFNCSVLFKLGIFICISIRVQRYIVNQTIRTDYLQVVLALPNTTGKQKIAKRSHLILHANVPYLC